MRRYKILGRAIIRLIRCASMQVVFVIASLSLGGSERVALSLCNHWSNAGHQVTIVTVASRKSDFYSADPQINRVALGLDCESRNVIEFLRNNTRRIQGLRSAIRSAAPDVVVSFGDTTNVLAILAGLGTRIPVVVSERSDPRLRKVGRIVRLLRHLLYRHAQAVVMQTKSAADWVREIVADDAVHVIPNHVLVPGFNAFKRDAPSGRLTVLAMGRMSEEKGFDLLLRAFALCAKRQGQWDLRIVGDGPERRRLNTLAEELGIANQTRLDGPTQFPYTVLADADLFVLPSRREGFPNALLEAMACGLPVISFDCLSGPSEIISHGQNGLLIQAGDVEGLAAAMDRLMSSDWQRKQLAANAVGVVDRYRPERIFAKWDRLLGSVIG